MGIKNLMKIITKYAPDAITYTTINKYKNKTIAIDANLMIYKMVYAIRLNGYDIKNNNIIVTHIHSLLLKIRGFIKYNITPIFVFDNIAPSIKQLTLDKRKEFHNIMNIKYYKAVTQDEKKKYYFAKSEITYKEIKECIELIKLFNYTVIEAPEEADSQLANLMKNNKVDYIATDDMDILVFGGNKILKNFTVSDKKKIQEINLDVFKKSAKLTQNQLIDLGILLGCDYCPCMKGIGPVGAYNKIQKYYTIEKIIKKEHLTFPQDYIKAREYFKNAPVIDNNKIKINKMNINKEGIIKFLHRLSYDDKYINNLFTKLKTIS